MAKIYDEELKKQIEETLQRTRENINNRYDRIDKGYTDMDDCFISQRVNENMISECLMQLEILKGDGLMEIEVLEDENGKQFEPRWVNTRYGSKIVVNGIFANSKKALIKKSGYKVTTKNVPCWTKFICGSGGGMCGVYTGYYGIVRWHTNMVTGEYVGYDD